MVSPWFCLMIVFVSSIWVFLKCMPSIIFFSITTTYFLSSTPGTQQTSPWPMLASHSCRCLRPQLKGHPLRRPILDPLQMGTVFPASLLHAHCNVLAPHDYSLSYSTFLSYWHHSVNSLWTEDPGRLVCAFSSGRESISQAAATDLLMCSMHEWRYKG